MIEILVAAIQLDSFDQQKLEGLMRKIPSALVSTETIGATEKKTYVFPKMEDKGFKVNCTAIHYLGNQLPSKTDCTLNMLKDADARFDEHLVEFKDPFTVKSLYNAISFGTDVKKFYSTERVYGLGVNGKYQENFRYVFSCTKEKCQVTMSTK